MLNIPYPYAVFNNSVTASAQGFNQNLNLVIKRVSSVAVEPLYFSSVLTDGSPVTIFAVFRRTPDNIIL
jgi:hypothetical protein